MSKNNPYGSTSESVPSGRELRLDEYEISVKPSDPRLDQIVDTMNGIGSAMTNPLHQKDKAISPNCKAADLSKGFKLKSP